MLKRKIEEKLLFWLNNRKQALLVTGARQVGKSYSINKFIKNEFESVVEINFADRTDLIDIFANLSNADDLILRLSMVAGDRLVKDSMMVVLWLCHRQRR